MDTEVGAAGSSGMWAGAPSLCNRDPAASESPQHHLREGRAPQLSGPGLGRLKPSHLATDPPKAAIVQGQGDLQESEFGAS